MSTPDAKGLRSAGTTGAVDGPSSTPVVRIDVVSDFSCPWYVFWEPPCGVDGGEELAWARIPCVCRRQTCTHRIAGSLSAQYIASALFGPRKTAPEGWRVESCCTGHGLPAVPSVDEERN